MTDYTPTTEEVMAQFAWYNNLDYDRCVEYEAEFNRWLAQHDKKLGERIAKDIRALDWGFRNGDSIQQIVMPQVRDRCANIARGNK